MALFFDYRLMLSIFAAFSLSISLFSSSLILHYFRFYFHAFISDI